MGEQIKMEKKKIFKLVSETVKNNLIDFVRSLPTDSKNPLVVCIQEMTRTLEQNARMWATLTDISKQVVWHGLTLTAEQWKHVFTATLKGQKTVPNLDGTGFIVLGQSTRVMSKRELSNLLELAYSFGAEKGVKWSEKAKSDLLIFEWYKNQLSKVA
ncbi:recombination protein NinB [Gilliamella sp. B3781]|nr:recombination protein NinB [Gilliamella sp. B3835]MCX8706495.1 recombination protein NinB [Gilliamella sp. B3783]MCX8709162.1 recombination protein NinB [Gilliamella sp. B3780]MCX8714534.1 recombination protein NinB [Gilliamella sp. B3781]MCX8715901.1 recombination protein NinB [Gilliamella sp. B3784]MCX8718025.1 recombination protein NinB [Gilliamella sp. B3788]MCX8740291.1 recombination protein NinB [Gilliamella sp. B3791]